MLEIDFLLHYNTFLSPALCRVPLRSQWWVCGGGSWWWSEEGARLGWGCCFGGVCAGHSANQVRLSANRVQKSVFCWLAQTPAANDTGKTVVPNACSVSSQPPLCTTGGRDLAMEAQAGDCVPKMDVFDPVGFAGGCRLDGTLSNLL